LLLTYFPFFYCWHNKKDAVAKTVTASEKSEKKGFIFYN